jgi:hypothetical protein
LTLEICHIPASFILRYGNARRIPPSGDQAYDARRSAPAIPARSVAQRNDRDRILSREADQQPTPVVCERKRIRDRAAQTMCVLENRRKCDWVDKFDDFIVLRIYNRDLTCAFECSVGSVGTAARDDGRGLTGHGHTAGNFHDVVLCGELDNFPVP